MDDQDTTRKHRELLPEKIAKKNVGGAMMMGLVALMILLGIAAVVSLSHYLNEQLFLERRTHLLEIAEKVGKIVDVTIESAWGDVLTCEKLLEEKETVSREELLELLTELTEYIPGEDRIVLTMDESAAYYTSDGQTGHWNDPTILTAQTADQQVIIAALPYMNANDAHMVFIQRMERAVSLEGSEAQITHVAIAVSMNSLRDIFAVPGYNDSCYTFLVNAEGRRLYKNTNLQEFIDGYNILNAMGDYEVLQGDTLEELRDAVGNEQQACMELRYRDRDYYVGTALIPSVHWEVLLFVPTDVLGANTMTLMERMGQYFLAIGLVVLALLCTLFCVFMSAYNNNKLMIQQRESNVLLAKAAKEAEAANLAKSEFLSRMSHDIRTPINGIMGMTEIASQNTDDPVRIKDCLGKINGSSRHLLSLVNDVLDMSSIESGKTVLAQEPMDLRMVLNNCASIILGQLMERQVDFVTQFTEFSHPALVGDELRLRQVFINILGNAVKFTADGGKIMFSAEELSATDQQATFRFIIEDTGRGMSEDFLEHIFEPFSQEAGQHVGNTYTGTGLGMAITKQFVELMGGTIQVESQLGIGSKFTLEITFQVGEARQMVQEPMPQIAGLSGMRILLVEDNELNMEIATYMLEEDGIIVTTAGNGQEAVDIFSSRPLDSFDVILMDVMMPVMDGITATKTIRALPREDAVRIPIIAMTANAYKEDRQRTMEAGMNEHLSKPIDGVLLLKTLSQYRA